MNYENLKIPNHVGIILDGNGRWAKSRGLNRSAGHKAGYENLKELCVHILDVGVKYLSVYAFSTENFKRSEEEVGYLMNLVAKKFKSDAKFFMKNDVKVVFSGVRENLRKDVLESMDYVTNLTKDNKKGVFNVCINYGGHLELTDMTKKISKLVKEDKIKIEDINEELISKSLYQDLPPIDFLIRTSGEQRVSNFMLWQLSYAEFYFPKVHFPDFNKEEFNKALIEYTKRDRRFGGINYETKSN
ncbi:MAG: di-trans,poly-cis-decaprenylcistransferase [Bacilli bacterium]|nr:di-trans,poly-cis-decaprenylcistransferase [Bacilli bacterium]